MTTRTRTPQPAPRRTRSAAGVLRGAGDLLCARVSAVLTRFCGLPSRVAMVDPHGLGVVASTEPQWVAAA